MVCEYWKGDNVINDFVVCLLGFGDFYDLCGCCFWLSVNFIIVYDGFMLNDLVFYNDKYNEVNGEDNNDGYNDNCFCNYGVEGLIDGEGINVICE